MRMSPVSLSRLVNSSSVVTKHLLAITLSFPLMCQIIRRYNKHDEDTALDLIELYIH